MNFDERLKQVVSIIKDRNVTICYDNRIISSAYDF